MSKPPIIDAEIIDDPKNPDARFVGSEVCSAAADVAAVAAKVVAMVDAERGQKIAEVAGSVRKLGEISAEAAEKATVIAGQAAAAGIEGKAALGRLSEAWKRMADTLPKRTPLTPRRR
jgi:hypothetical protein